MRQRLLGMALAAGILSVAPANAMPIPAIDVPAMTRAAELIVVGRANGIEIQNDSETFSVSVDRVLKGMETNPPNVLIRFNELDGHESVNQRQYGIFFLRRAPAGASYIAVDPFHPILVASPARDANATGSADLNRPGISGDSVS